MTYIETREECGNGTKLTVQHKETGAEVTIIPEMGARLNNFLVSLHGETIDVIDGLTNEEIESGEASSKGALLAPFPNRVADGKSKWKKQEY